MGAPLHGFLLAVVGGTMLSLSAASAALAQTASPARATRSLASDGAGLQAAPAEDAAVVRASAKILPAQGNQPARLQVTANVKDGWHIYSITQKPGGPVKTKIKIPESTQYKLGEFTAITPPVSHPEPDFDNLIVEEHSGEVVWEAPLTMAVGATAPKIAGAVNAQACSTACMPPADYKFEAPASAGKGDLSTGP